MSRWTQGKIISLLQAVHKESGYYSSYQWMQEHRSPHFYTIIHFFGSWHAAWEAAGFGEVPLRLAPKDKLVTADMIVKVMQEVGRFESERVWSTNRRSPSAPSIRKVFGSWQSAWEAAGLWDSPVSPKERIIARLQAMDHYCSETYWDQMGYRPVAQTIRNHFGTWANAWREAGIIPTPAKVHLGQSEIAERLREYGHYCTARQWDGMKMAPTSRTIRKIFGSWKAAWDMSGVPYPASRSTITREGVLAALKEQREYVPAQLWDALGQKPSSHTVRKLFGSWAAAWDEAGVDTNRAGSSIVTPHETPTRLLTDLDAQLWSARQNGHTLQELSAEFGLSTSTIARRILRARTPGEAQSQEL